MMYERVTLEREELVMNTYFSFLRHAALEVHHEVISNHNGRDSGGRTCRSVVFLCPDPGRPAGLGRTPDKERREGQTHKPTSSPVNFY